MLFLLLRLCLRENNNSEENYNDDAHSYTCYDVYRLTYEQYKDSDDEEKQSWAEQAKMRANKTASSYNNYVMKNSFVWKNNIPIDIYAELEYIE